MKVRMNLKAAVVIGLLTVLVITYFIDSLIVAVVGPVLLLAAIGYGWAANRTASRENLRQAEEATHRQREERAHERR